MAGSTTTDDSVSEASALTTMVSISLKMGAVPFESAIRSEWFEVFFVIIVLF